MDKFYPFGFGRLDGADIAGGVEIEARIVAHLFERCTRQQPVQPEAVAVSVVQEDAEAGDQRVGPARSVDAR